MMDFLIKSTVSLIILYGVYILLLEKEKMHQFNRFFLLFSLVFSFSVPFVAFEFEPENTHTFTSKTLETVVLPNLELKLETNYLEIILYSIYGIITTLLLIRFTWNLYALHVLRKKAKIIIYENARLALVDEEILPHTFGSTIFINKKDYENHTIESELLTHELTHVRQKHTLDIVFIEVLKTIFWFNPLLIFYKKAIQLNHEFLADEKVITSHKDISIYQKILLSKSIQPTNLYLTSNLTSFLKTKKRLIMMTKTTSTTTKFFKKVIVAPLFLGMFIFGSSLTFAQESPVQKTEQSEENIYSQVDKLPDFPGGIQAFYEFVGRNFKVPNVKNLSGKIFVQFVVEKDGTLSKIKLMRDIGYGTGEEAIRVLKLSPKWIPGEQNGKKVRVLYSLPILVKTE
ncbi:M56 family metallopeptidase [Flavobacterium sp.]|uniref:M56 family metallopeptidase n=1 Tax=Flavobacterium sp. TaxID=239 RepID=UPI00261C8FE5|nr:M56 family metallopeptidase [Flavobacterium sp.]MDD3004251.1 M56 family metallopeptidase [Flavobacterium sp.]